MKEKAFIPYYNTLTKKEDVFIFRFLKRKFLPSLKKKFEIHYLFCQDIRKYLNFISQKSQKYSFFLVFDIEKYFPSICHQILLEKLPQIYQTISHKNPSRRFQKIIKKNLPSFLEKLPIKNHSLPLGNPLSFLLAALYLLPLDLAIPCPFLRFCDDYLLFSNSKKNLEKILSQIIIPQLEKLKLSLNFSKINSGRFFKDKVSFLGFEFAGGYKRISEERIKNFKKKIVEITVLKKKKPLKAIIKVLNNQILGFGNYYKLADCKNALKDLDGFCRFRLRRCILRNRHLFPKTSNLLLSNKVLKGMGLKSLIEIKEKFDKKFKKIKKNKAKSGKQLFSPNWQNLEIISSKYTQIEILKEVQKMTTLLKKMENKMRKIEKKLNENK